MTAIQDLYSNVRNFANIFDYSDELIDVWVRFAEERLNTELRDTTMQTVAVISPPKDDTVETFTLPNDWVETRWLRYAPGDFSGDFSTQDFNTAVSVNDSSYTTAQAASKCKPLRPCTPDQYFQVLNDGFDRDRFAAVYMTNGLTLNVFPTLSSGRLELGYYSKIPALGDTPTPLWASDTRLYTYATLAAAVLYEKDDARLATFETLASARITARNEATQKSLWGPGPLHMRRTPSFG